MLAPSEPAPTNPEPTQPQETHPDAYGPGIGLEMLQRLQRPAPQRRIAPAPAPEVAAEGAAVRIRKIEKNLDGWSWARIWWPPVTSGSWERSPIARAKQEELLQRFSKEYFNQFLIKTETDGKLTWENAERLGATEFEMTGEGGFSPPFGRFPEPITQGFPLTFGQFP